jgi:hypothetical protein
VSYRIRLPAASGSVRLDIVEPNSTSVQRALRRGGLAAYEPPTVATLLTLFEGQPPGFGFFDVGANMGLYALLCAKLFEPGVVTGFEPTPSTASVARKIVKANRLDIDVVAAALSDENGEATLHLSPVSDSSNSLVEGFRAGAARGAGGAGALAAGAGAAVSRALRAGWAHRPAAAPALPGEPARAAGRGRAPPAAPGAVLPGCGSLQAGE